jgi:hypothetical protein
MKAWSLFYPYVMPEVIGAPEPLVDQALRLAARDFCQRGTAWVEFQDELRPLESSNRFEFDVPSGAELVKVLSAVVGTTELDVFSNGDLPADWTNARSTTLRNKLVHLEGDEFLVFPLPTEPIRLRLAFKPMLSATTVGDEVLNKWGEDVAAGAKSRLMAMRGMPFTDLTSSAINKAQFESAIHRCANRGFALRSPGTRVTKKAPL